MLLISNDGPNGSLGPSQVFTRTLPPWVHDLGVPAWVISADYRIQFLNPLAEQLLDIQSEHAQGQDCAHIIGGQSSEGIICKQPCFIKDMLEKQVPVPPIAMKVGTPETTQHWIKVVYLPVDDSQEGGPCLVCCAVDFDLPRRLERYIQKIALRSSVSRRLEKLPVEPLSKRELEILELLANDCTLRTIARRLFISHSTVRNHVRNLLAKIGAHSIHEAIAMYLLRSRT